MKWGVFAWLLFLLCFVPGYTLARDIYVEKDKGNDAHDGQAQRPLKSIARAIALAEPGDVIHLTPTTTPYNEVATFHNKSGLPGKPITLDGHGATLSGCDPLNPKDWQEISPGLYRNDKLVRPDPAIIARFYFIFDGKMNHMGRTSKGASRPFLKPEELKPGEWTFQKSDNAFYIKIDPKRSLRDYRIEAPLRSNGVAISGECNHLVIRNVRATHVHNDGFNIHGKTRDIFFQNVEAIDCGDDGMSAHDDCEIRVDGFLSSGNSTGICHVGHSTSQSNRVVIRDCLGVDFYMLGSNRHTLSNSIIIAGQQKTVIVSAEAKSNDTCTVQMENVAIVNRTGQPRTLRVGKGGHFEGRRLTFYGINLELVGGSVELRDSVVGGEPHPEILIWPGVTWRANGNVYDLKSLRLGQTSFTPANIADYVRASAQDTDSKWVRLEFAKPLTGRLKGPVLPKGVGADISALGLIE